MYRPTLSSALKRKKLEWKKIAKKKRINDDFNEAKWSACGWLTRLWIWNFSAKVSADVFQLTMLMGQYSVVFDAVSLSESFDFTSLMNNPLGSGAVKNLLHEFIVLPGCKSISKLESEPSSGRNLSCSWLLQKISLLAVGSVCRSLDESESLSASRKKYTSILSHHHWPKNHSKKWNWICGLISSRHKKSPKLPSRTFLQLYCESSQQFTKLLDWNFNKRKNQKPKIMSRRCAKIPVKENWNSFTSIQRSVLKLHKFLRIEERKKNDYGELNVCEIFSAVTENWKILKIRHWISIVAFQSLLRMRELWFCYHLLLFMIGLELIWGFCNVAFCCLELKVQLIQ